MHLIDPALQLHEVVMTQAADGAAKGGGLRDNIVCALTRGLLGYAHDGGPQRRRLSGHQRLRRASTRISQ